MIIIARATLNMLITVWLKTYFGNCTILDCTPFISQTPASKSSDKIWLYNYNIGFKKCFILLLIA